MWDVERQTAVLYETPPPPQAETERTRFVPYQTDRTAKAFAWALREHLAVNPNAVATLRAIESLVKQHLAGQRQ